MTSTAPMPGSPATARAVFFARFVPLLRALISYPPAWPACRWAVHASLGGRARSRGTAAVTAGWLLGENYEALYETIRPFEILIYVVVVLGGAFILIRWIRGRGSPREV